MQMKVRQELVEFLRSSLGTFLLGVCFGSEENHHPGLSGEVREECFSHWPSHLGVMGAGCLDSLRLG